MKKLTLFRMGRRSQRGLMWVAFLAVLAVSATASAAPVTIPLSDFVIFSGGSLAIDAGYETIIGGHTVINGNIGSNQDLSLQGNPLTGYPAQLNGSAYAGGNLTFGQDLTVGSSSGPLREIVANGAANIGGSANIYGNLYADEVTLGQLTGIRQVGGSGGNVEYTTSYTPSTATVEGSVLQNTADPTTFGIIDMPTMTLTGFTNTQGIQDCGGSPCTVTLAPNTLTTGYGEVLVNQGRTLELQSGDYYLESISNNGTLTLKIDLTSGNPININVVDGVSIGQDAVLWVTNAVIAASGDPDLVNGYLPISHPLAQSLAALINWNILGLFDLGGGDIDPDDPIYTAIFGGIVYSSKVGEGVLIGQAVDFYGALYAVDELRLLDHSKFNFVPIPGAVWLLGSGLIGLVAIRRKRSVK